MITDLDGNELMEIATEYRYSPCQKCVACGNRTLCGRLKCQPWQREDRLFVYFIRKDDLNKLGVVQ